MEDAPMPDTVLRNPDDGHRIQDVPLPDKYRKRIHDNLDVLHSDVDLDLILTKCAEKDVITEVQLDKWWHMVRTGDKRDANLQFITVLPSRGRNAYLWFCHIVLTKAQQQHLYDLLVDDEAVELIGKMTGVEDNLSRQMSHAPGLQTSQESSPNNSYTRGAAPDDQTVPKLTEESIEGATIRQESFTVSPVQVQDAGDVESDYPEPCAAAQPPEGASVTSTPGLVGSDAPDTETYEEYEITEADPAWVRGLREYQKELAEPGIRGLNYIVCAPTGCGKTMVAGYVIYHHLKKLGDAGRVVFFAPTVGLVKQHHEDLEKWFPSHKVEYIVGPEAEDKDPVDILIRYYHIVVLTPEIFRLALQDKRLEGLHLVTLMIFDECHHAHGENVYNRIMGQYVDNKLKIQHRDPKVNPRLPQVVGMTASLGVGDARANESAVQFVLQKCANLDAKMIAVVKHNKKELDDKVNEPEEEMAMIPARSGDPFSVTMMDIMRTIERAIKETENVRLSDLEFPQKKDNLVYQSYLSNVHWRMLNLPPELTERMKVISCLQHLACYTKSLELYDEVRARDALKLLEHMFTLRGADIVQNDLTEKWLAELYNNKQETLEELSISPECRNPKLIALKKMILDAYKEEPDTYAILFTKTKIATDALKNWVNQDPDLGVLNAVRLTGTSSEDSAGMSSRHQQDVVKHFKEGRHKLLIATSVAEEGLDIKACNCVFRYNYTSNEIARVQAKGRTRTKKSKMMTVTSEDKRKLQDKEKVNLFRESLMRDAVKKISVMDSALYQERIRQLQVDASRERQQKEWLRRNKNAGKDRSVFMICCYRCERIVCKSDQMVVFHNNHHTCRAEGFEQLIKVLPHKRPQRYGLMTKLNKVRCKECNHDWGILNDYNDRVKLPVLKASGFGLFRLNPDGSRGERVSGPPNKKWDDVPCAFPEITDNEEIYRIFAGKEYPVTH